MEALTSDLKELSDQFERSLLVRSKPMRSQTWLRKLKRDSWTKLLCGRTLKLSHGNNFTEKWTSSVAASLASHLVLLVGEQETKTQDIFGPTFYGESSEWGDLPLFSSKMSRASSAQKSSLKDGQTPSVRPFCCMSLESWKRWVTQRRQEYSARLKSVRHTNENECLYLQYQTNSQKMDVILSQSSSTEKNWPTPKALEIQETVEQWTKRRQKPKNKMMGPSLSVAVQLKEDQQLNDSTQKSTEQPTLHLEDKSSTHGKLQEQSPKKQNWATPTAMEGGEIGNAPFGNKGQLGLSNDPQVHKNWTTPAARDWKGEYSKASQEKKFRNLLPDQAHLGTYKGYLNPRWVEHLMGLPVGWVQISSSEVTITEQTSLGSLETESSLIVQQKLSKPCGKNWPTPPASQRGEDLEVYIRKSINRVKKGGVKFAPTLQVAVEAEDKQIEINNFLKHNINMKDNTEVIVKSIMKEFYKKESQKDTAMTKKKKKVILDLTREMIIQPAEIFSSDEFKESVKLFVEIIQALIEEDDQKDNI
jgi:hypothetical protein